MVRLTSPAPGGTFGLEYGNTTQPPYSTARPHRGQDWEREWRDLSKPRPVVASAGGRVTSVYAGNGNNQGWGRRVEITVPSTTHHIVVALNHLDSIGTAAGRDIASGGYVGEMGNSGETFGVHLHEELWIDGVRVDPNYYRTRDLPGTAPSPAGGGSKPFEPEGFLMALNDDQQQAVYNNIAGDNTPFADFIAKRVKRELDIRDRRNNAIMWVGQDAWIVDFGAGTRYNAARGHQTVSDAIGFISWLRDGLGWSEYRNQAPFTIAGLTDVTAQGTVREEVRRGMLDAAADS